MRWGFASYTLRNLNDASQYNASGGIQLNYLINPQLTNPSISPSQVARTPSDPAFVIMTKNTPNMQNPDTSALKPVVELALSIFAVDFNVGPTMTKYGHIVTPERYSP